MKNSGEVRLLDAALLIDPQRHAEAHSRAFATFGFDLQCSARQRSPLLHAKQPDPPRLALAIGYRTEAAPIVVDQQDDLVIASLEDYADDRRAGVFVGIVQRFLNYPIQVRFDDGSQAETIQSASVKSRRNGKRLGPFGDEAAKRRNQSELIQRRRSQFPGELIDIAI